MDDTYQDDNFTTRVVPRDDLDARQEHLNPGLRCRVRAHGSHVVPRRTRRMPPAQLPQVRGMTTTGTIFAPSDTGASAGQASGARVKHSGQRTAIARAVLRPRGPLAEHAPS
jgi:hypothetical protein